MCPICFVSDEYVWVWVIDKVYLAYHWSVWANARIANSTAVPLLLKHTLTLIWDFWYSLTVSAVSHTLIRQLNIETVGLETCPRNYRRLDRRGSVTLSGDINDTGVYWLGSLGIDAWKLFRVAAVFPACYAKDWWGCMLAFMFFLIFLILWSV